MMAQLDNNSSNNEQRRRRQRITMFDTLLIAYGGAILWALLFIVGIGLAIYFDTHEQQTLAQISGIGGTVCLFITIIWMGYFFGDGD